MAALFAIAAWPHVARGVRAIVATERTRDYARSGARDRRRPVPAARGISCRRRAGFSRVEIVLLVPALLVAEATVSYLGLGFPEPQPELGHDAAGRGQRQRASRGALDAGAGRRDVPRRAASVQIGGTTGACRTCGTLDASRMRACTASFRPSRPPLPPAATSTPRAITANVERWMRTGLAGILALGSNGEAALLDEDECDRVVAAARDAVPRDRDCCSSAPDASRRARRSRRHARRRARRRRGARAHAVVSTRRR